MGCSIIWASKLQGKMALSTTKAKYNAGSEALRNVLSIMSLLEEAVSFNIDVAPPKTKILCKLFCDNSGACELIRLPKMRPCTKHINTKLHHFREHVANGRILVQQVTTEVQVADIATKQLPNHHFSKFCKVIMDW
jgi:hypothetical protein